MVTTIKKSVLQGNIKIPESKSVAHRMLICSALAGNGIIKCENLSDDIKATADCLSKLCADISYENGYYKTTYKVIPDSAMLCCGESGSTYRFLFPIACALGINSEFHLAGQLPARPMKVLFDNLKKQGAVIIGSDTQKVCVSGKLTSGNFYIPGDVSSQFVSGLIFALPLLEGDSRIIIDGKLQSESYVNITIQAVEKYGIKVERLGQTYFIAGRQKYKSPGRLEVEADWSNAAFWLAAGALSERGLSCSGLNIDSLQGDKKILELLQNYGANIITDNDKVFARAGRLKAIEIDAEDIPDLVPILAVVALAAEGQTVIKNIKRLAIKESNRILSTAAMIKSLGGMADYDDNQLIIKGNGSLCGGVVDSYKDHRIAMASSIAAVICRNPVSIISSESVRKSYPGFYRDYEKLGGICEEKKDLLDK